MNKTELVKRLGVLEAFLGGDYEMGGHWFGETVAGRPYWWRAKMREYLTDAISYINATPSRDEVPEEALAKCKELHHRLAGKAHLAQTDLMERGGVMRPSAPLKSAPNTKEAPQPEKFVPKDAGTQAQIAAVMLATGTPEQQAEVLAHMASEARVVAQPEKPGLVEETLRDRLAMAALTGLLAANATYGGRSDNRGALSRDAYATADAMLDARQGEK